MYNDIFHPFDLSNQDTVSLYADKRSSLWAKLANWWNKRLKLRLIMRKYSGFTIRINQHDLNIKSKERHIIKCAVQLLVLYIQYIESMEHCEVTIQKYVLFRWKIKRTCIGTFRVYRDVTFTVRFRWFANIY